MLNQWLAIATALARMNGAGTRLHDAALQAGKPGPLAEPSARLFHKILAAYPEPHRVRVEAELTDLDLTIPAAP